MQRFRRSALMLLATGSVALAAACGSGGSSTTTVTESGGQLVAPASVLTERGSTLVAPLVSQWEADYLTKKSVTITYGAVGSGGGIDAITARSGRLRCERRSVQFRPGHGLQELHPDPVGAAADVRAYNLERCARSSAADRARCWPTCSWATSRPGTTAKIKALNPGVNLPSHQDHADLPQRRLRRQLRRSRTTCRPSARTLKSKIGASTQPPFSVGHRRREAARVLRPRCRAPTARSATSRCPTSIPTSCTPR